MPDPFAVPPGGNEPPRRHSLEDIFGDVEPAAGPPAVAPRPPVPPRAAPPPNLPGAAGVVAPPPPPPPPPPPSPRPVGTPAPLPTPGAIPPARGVGRTPPEDILSGVDQSQPRVSLPWPPAPPEVPKVSSPQGVERQVTKQPPLLARRSFLIGLAVFVLLVFLGIGGLFAFQWWGRRGPPAIPTSAPAATPPAPPLPSPTPSVAPAPVEQASPSPVPAEVEIDSDHDGLTDREEKLYGTNIFATDTDGDGLTDRDEVKAFKTEPVDPDTDGDGFPDGTEVNNGYNPLGPGKIKEAPPG